MKFTPLIFAAILFLVIRLVNDLPPGENYFMVHSAGFIATELAGIMCGSYLCFHLAGKWVRFSTGNHLNFMLEYGTVLLFPTLLAVIIMSISHESDLYEKTTLLVIPIVITGLMSLWLYTTMKTNYIDSLFSASRLKEKEARNARIETELRLLRSQYHPHFLFNMLNTIYFSIEETNTVARDTVEHLANLLRAQLYDDDSPVPIAREISALTSFIELCRIRYGDSLNLSVSLDESYPSSRIHPHLLLPLVENAVKHSGGGSTRQISVLLTRTPDTIDFQVENTFPLQTANNPDNHNSGIGLSSLRKRLELLYEDKYSLTLKQDSGIYSAHLHLLL